MCIPCGPSHEPTSFKSGGKKTGHAESQVFKLHYKLTMQSNGITAFRAPLGGVPESGELTGDRRCNTIKDSRPCHDKGCKLKTVFIKVTYLFKSTVCLLPLQPNSFLSSPFFDKCTQRHSREPIWLWTGVNHGSTKRITVLNTLPPPESLLLNKGVKRCICLPSFWR